MLSLYARGRKERYPLRWLESHRNEEPDMENRATWDLGDLLYGPVHHLFIPNVFRL